MYIINKLIFLLTEKKNWCFYQRDQLRILAARGAAAEGPASRVLGAILAGGAVIGGVRAATVIKGLGGIGGVLILSCLVRALLWGGRGGEGGFKKS
jgi:hypothetical protein